MSASKPEVEEPKADMPNQLKFHRGEMSRARTFVRMSGIAAGAALAMLLTACGGGGGGGGGPPPPPPVTCVSQNASSESGFALGVCPDPQRTVFQEVGTTVTPQASPRQYTLNLVFPAGQPANLSGIYTFTEAANKTPFGARDLIGGIRGDAFEQPLEPQGPYTAITSFHRFWDSLTAPVGSPAHTFAHIDFGVWERFGGETSDGYFGSWYTAWTSDAVRDWPSAARIYEGPVVGVLSPHHAAGDTHSSRTTVMTYGFSAKIRITVDAQGRIVEGESAISDLLVSFPDPLDPNNKSLVEAVSSVAPMAIRQASGGASPAVVTGDLVLAGGSSGFEAEFFGTAGAPATEIAGRFRFRTGAGLHAIGSFGAFVPASPQ